MGHAISRILRVSGSPRRDGNTDLLVQEALRLLHKQTGALLEFVRVPDLRIERCRGCRACMHLGRCAVEGDDFEGLMRRFFAADLFVLGAPVYWLGPPGPMKDFIDRTHGYYRDHTILRGKRATLITVAADSGFEPHEAVMESWLRIYGAGIAGSARVFAREKGEVLRRPEAFQAVQRLVDALTERDE